MTAENNAGQMSGSSMRTSVRHWLTPCTLAASTNAGFMLRKAAEIIT